MSEQFWSRVIEGIDEKFTDEAAEYFARHAHAEYDSSDGREYSAQPVKLSPERESGKKRRLWIGIGSAAAALVLCVAAGAFLMRGGEPMLSVADPTTEVTTETTETVEQLIIEMTAEAEIIESAETTDIPDPDAWQRMKQYTGDDPEILEFCDMISEDILAYQEQNKQGVLETAGSEDSRLAAQEAIDSGGLDAYAGAVQYAEADNGGEFWLKSYGIQMALNADMYEIYFHDENGFRLLHSFRGAYHGAICSGEALYFGYGDGRINAIHSDGTMYEALDATVKPPTDAAVAMYYLAVLGMELSGTGRYFEAVIDYGYYSSVAQDWVYCRDSYTVEGTQIISEESTGYGYSIYNGMAMPYPISTGAHDHTGVSMMEDDLMVLGRMKLQTAISLYQIRQRLAAVDESVPYSGENDYYLLDDSNYSSKTGYFSDIRDRYDSLFSEDMAEYGTNYYATSAPAETPWLTESDRSTTSLWEDTDKFIRRDEDGKEYGSNGSLANAYEMWSYITGIIDYDDTHIDYQLCTICYDDSTGGYIYEHSVMTLESFDGVWKITKLRPRLGNEYGQSRLDRLVEEGFDYLAETPKSYVDIQCELLESDGFTVIDKAEADFDYDDEQELFILAEKKGERTIFVYENWNYAWELAELFSDERLKYISKLDFHLYDDGEGRRLWFFVCDGGDSLAAIEFTPSDDEYNYNGGDFIVTDMPPADETGSGHRCCLQALKDAAGEEFGKAVLDTDNDGAEEALVHFGYSLYVFEAVDGYLIQQQEFGYDTLMQADIASINDELVIYRYQGENSGFLFFEFPYSDSYKQATVTAAIKHNGRDGYYIEYLCSAGTLEGEPFFRYGWDFTEDWYGEAPFSPISEDTYNDYRSRLFFLHNHESGPPEGAYTVPAALPYVAYHTPQWEEFYTSPTTDEDIYWFAVELAEKLLGQLEGYGVDNVERTFSIHEYKDVNVQFYPVSEADSRWNITAEEKRLDNAWIVDISAEFRYTGEINGVASDDWCGDLYDENIGFLMYRKGNTFFIKSRYYNGSEEIASYATVRAHIQTSFLKAQELTRMIYTSGIEAQLADAAELQQEWFELTDFPYSCVEEIEAELLKYYTEDIAQELRASEYFKEIDGKLCARVPYKGLSFSVFGDLYDVDVLMQQGDKIWFSVPVEDQGYREPFISGAHCVYCIDTGGGQWKYAYKIQ